MSGLFVLDTSVTMAWCLTDETNPYANDVLDVLMTNQAIVPAIWTLEVANVLLMSERRGRLTTAMTENFLGLLHKLRITVDTHSISSISERIIDLGRNYATTSYDAAYLDLALRENLPVASIDARMKVAMLTLGVPLFDPACVSRS